MANNLVTRFPNGVTTNDEDHPLADLKQLDPSQYHTYMEDFDAFLLTDGTAAQWTVTAASTGTAALTAVNGGALLLTAANTDEDLIQAQRTTATWLPEAGKKTFFKARLKVSTAALTDIFIGLSVIDTSLIAASALGTTECMGFFKAATDTTLSFYNRLNGTTGSTSATSIGTVADNTYFTVGFYYDGVDKVYYAFNDVIYGSVSGSATYLPNTVMSPAVAIAQEGTDGANTGTIDYIFVAQER
jgi:hypothetical protein